MVKVLRHPAPFSDAWDAQLVVPLGRADVVRVAADLDGQLAGDALHKGAQREDGQGLAELGRSEAVDEGAVCCDGRGDLAQPFRRRPAAIEAEERVGWAEGEAGA